MLAGEDRERLDQLIRVNEQLVRLLTRIVEEGASRADAARVEPPTPLQRPRPPAPATREIRGPAPRSSGPPPRNAPLELRHLGLRSSVRSALLAVGIDLASELERLGVAPSLHAQVHEIVTHHHRGG